MATDRRRALPATVVVPGRLITAALAAAMGAIHLHLWSTGYRHVPTIGTLFLINGIIGLLLGAALLTVPGRLLGLVAAVSATFTAGTLLALGVSLTTGLFGFKEFTGAPFLDATVAVEAAGIIAAGALAAFCARTTLAGGPPLARVVSSKLRVIRSGGRVVHIGKDRSARGRSQRSRDWSGPDPSR